MLGCLRHASIVAAGLVALALPGVACQPAAKVVGSLASDSAGGGGTSEGNETDGDDRAITAPCQGLECDVERSWCDPATWADGIVPTASTDVTIAEGLVVVDCDAEAASVEVLAPGTLAASRTVASTLTVYGNVIVRGRLDYGTVDDRVGATVVAELIFDGMDDEQVVGTPDQDTADGLFEMEIVESDVGLWLVDDGVFTAAGQSKRAWSKLVEGCDASDPTFTVEDASGWEVGDRVMLTPAASRSADGFAAQFDERFVASVQGNTVTLDVPPSFEHPGCSSCMRRAEAANLSSNVVIRSYDDTAHAHIMVADRATVQFDGAELRWLGPDRACSGPDPRRRAPLYFHQQEGAATESFVRHVAIWGGQNHFMLLERSHGVEVVDVVGYDGFDVGFALFCENCEAVDASQRVVFTDVLAAKVGVAERVSGCARISHRHSAFEVSGGEGSGCVGCVATGVAYVGKGKDVSGFHWAEHGGRPSELSFEGNVAHNNNGHGAFIWQGPGGEPPSFADNQMWSNAGAGIEWAGIRNAYSFADTLLEDHEGPSFWLEAAQMGESPRIDGARLDDVFIATRRSHEDPMVLRDVTFSGEVSPGITQKTGPCDDGDENDPEDTACVRTWVRIENPELAPSMTPFSFGQSLNLHSRWQVVGFSHPDHSELSADFDLYRVDNQVAGGCEYPPFEAWIVPCP